MKREDFCVGVRIISGIFLVICIIVSFAMVTEYTGDKENDSVVSMWGGFTAVGALILFVIAFLMSDEIILLLSKGILWLTGVIFAGGVLFPLLQYGYWVSLYFDTKIPNDGMHDFGWKIFIVSAVVIIPSIWGWYKLDKVMKELTGEE